VNLNNSYTVSTEPESKNLNTLNYNVFDNNMSSVLKSTYLTNTVSGGNINVESVPVDYSNCEDKIIGTMNGAIINITNEYIRVKFDTDKIYDFPIKLVKNKVEVSLGQRLQYQIIESTNGFKRQDFAPLKNISNDSIIDKINNILK